MKEQTRFSTRYETMSLSKEYNDRLSSSSSNPDNVTKELKAAFAYFDRNCNGVIEMDELDAAMKSLGYRVTDKELRMMIGEVDVDGNGKIDFDEFVRMMNNATKIEKREGVELREAFKVGL